MIRSDGRERIHVIQGECVVSEKEDVVLTTVLGSCVAACMRDPVLKIGGMNHFLLPGEGPRDRLNEAERFGVYLMEVLVNGLLKRGARRETLEAKLFGGARTVRNFTDIGMKNVEFATRFLDNEGIRYAGGSTGGDRGRRLEYHPASGKARQILLPPAAVEPPPPPSAVRPEAGVLELF